MIALVLTLTAVLNRIKIQTDLAGFERTVGVSIDNDEYVNKWFVAFQVPNNAEISALSIQCKHIYQCKDLCAILNCSLGDSCAPHLLDYKMVCVTHFTYCCYVPG